MHTDDIERWTHEHALGNDLQRDGERRVEVVALLTAAVMLVEVAVHRVRRTRGRPCRASG